MSEQSDDLQRLEWRIRWLTSIQSFADTETQQQRWLDLTEDNPHFSYVECMCVYFDDVLFGEDKAYAQRLELGFLNEAEVAAVAAFHKLANHHESQGGDDWDNSAILKDPSWQKVARAAQQAQQDLLPLLSDPAEKEALMQPECWADEDGVYRAHRTGVALVRLRS